MNISDMLESQAAALGPASAGQSVAADDPGHVGGLARQVGIGADDVDGLARSIDGQGDQGLRGRYPGYDQPYRPDRSTAVAAVADLRRGGPSRIRD